MLVVILGCLTHSLSLPLSPLSLWLPFYLGKKIKFYVQVLLFSVLRFPPFVVIRKRESKERSKKNHKNPKRAWGGRNAFMRHNISGLEGRLGGVERTMWRSPNENHRYAGHKHQKERELWLKLSDYLIMKSSRSSFYVAPAFKVLWRNDLWVSLIQWSVSVEMNKKSAW